MCRGPHRTGGKDGENRVAWLLLCLLGSSVNSTDLVLCITIQPLKEPQKTNTVPLSAVLLSLVSVTCGQPQPKQLILPVITEGQ